MSRLQLTCKFIAHNIRRATLINLLGLAGASNATGDDQKKLDVLGNQIFLDTMKNCGKVAVIVSEEEDDAIIIKTKGAKYAVVCDPIDGIQNYQHKANSRLLQFGCWCFSRNYFWNI
jgi:fructose-1,6-bisphosphatase I